MSRFRTILASLILFVLTVAVFWPVRECGFVNLDDPDNVSRNPLVYNGPTLQGIKTAFMTSEPDYWRPLVWLSFMADVVIYGAEPGPSPIKGIAEELPDEDAWGFHFTNVLMHAMSAVMLLLALNSLTGAFWPSVAAAAIFAVHPLRVESVAWITERKDVLSGIFAFGAMWSYARFARSEPRQWSWMTITTVLLMLGLMSKSTLVTIPFVLLLLDLWPLRRIDLSGDWRSIARRIQRLVVEKIPLFSVMIASCIMTMLGGSRSVADFSLRLRLANSVVSYVRYLGKMFWPVDLAVYYPYPGIGGADPHRMIHVLFAVLVLSIITGAAFRSIRHKPLLFVGWMWFVGMLVPVIGLLQVGNQGLADRFTYLPGIGILIIVIWMLWEALERSTLGRLAGAAMLVATVTGCALATRALLPTWRNSDSLYQRALAVTSQNRAVLAYYGDFLFHQGRYAESLAQFKQAAELVPQDPMPHFKMGWNYSEMGKEYNYEAQKAFEEAIRLDPNDANAYFNLAAMLVRRNQPAAAWPHFQKALELNPEGADRYEHLRAALEAGLYGSPETSPSEPGSTTR